MGSQAVQKYAYSTVWAHAAVERICAEDLAWAHVLSKKKYAYSAV
jgi:hypothetical protein